MILEIWWNDGHDTVEAFACERDWLDFMTAHGAEITGFQPI